MRRLIALLLTFAMLAFASPPAVTFAADEPQVSDIRVKINGALLDAIVLTQAGRTLVPFRAVGDALGATVGWDQPTQTASLTLQDRTVQLQIGSKSATVKEGNQTRSVTLDAPALLYDSRTYVPARFVAEGLGYDVIFDGTDRVVLITTPAAAAGGGGGSGSGAAGTGAWLGYDVNGDGLLDGRDVRKMVEAGIWAAASDVNGDGKKDTKDTWAMLLKITEWDRNGDRVVDAADFGAPTPIALPQPNAETADRLVRSMLAEVEKKVPPDLEFKLQLEWTGVAEPAVLGSLWEQAGGSALAMKNLEVAQWAFAKAVITSPGRDSSLANLGFILAQTDRHEEAMQLYARAREINPRACTTNNNIGWVFARHGQVQEAISYYRQAVTECPNFAQVHLNLGAALLRTDNLAEARHAFDTAARLNPADKEALIMSVAANPADPKAMDEYGKQYEQEMQRMVNQGDIEDFDPWSELSARDRWEAIRQQISDQVWKDLQQQLDDLGQQTSDRLHAIAKKALPEGKDACADLQRWANHALPTFEVMQATVLAANKQADDLGRAAYARTAAQELSMGNLLLEMVLAEAQVEMLRWSGDAARQAFEKHVHYYYDLPMENAEERLRNPRTMGNFEIPDEQDLMQGVLLAGLLIPVGGALTPGYGETLDGCGAEPQGGEWKLQPGEPAFAVGIGIVQVEYKPNSDEVKLQVGQGLMAAGTWSPANGFGFQVGSGYNVKVGPGELSAAQWIKFGSDGSITQEIEGSASAGKGLDAGWQRSATREIRAATHEPIGALE